ncbi:hypothetical protein V8C40DRAFT_253156 [Trichoderma camerunense]
MHTKHRRRFDDNYCMSGSCLFSRMTLSSCQALASKLFLSPLTLTLLSSPLLSSPLLLDLLSPSCCCETLGMQPVQRFAPRCSHQISGYLGTHARSSGIWGEWAVNGSSKRTTPTAFLTGQRPRLWAKLVLRGSTGFRAFCFL